MDKKRVFGIDLGTTYSCIAVVDEAGKPQVLRNRDTQVLTPSVVQFEGEKAIVGNVAKEGAELYPETVTQMFKREMCNDAWSFSCNNKTYRPEDLSALVLREVVAGAQAQVTDPIKDVVITCPAWFGANQREATANAGKIADLNVLEIINEPTAAAICYGLDSADDEVVLVYDLGGGTFDITMIEIKDKKIDVICTGGNHYLGGRNWDAKIVQYLVEQYCASEGGDPAEVMENRDTLQELYNRAEDLKRRLSARERDKTAVNHNGKKVIVELTRQKFDEITSGLLEETVALTRQMLSEAKEKGRTKFNRILMVGGSTLMPQVPERLKSEFNVECMSFDPHEAVAKGAALYGFNLGVKREFEERVKTSGAATESQKQEVINQISKETGLQPLKIKATLETEVGNVTSRSFGVVIMDDHDKTKEIMSTLIKRNDTVPANVTRTFGTVIPNQLGVLVKLVESLATDDVIPMDQTEELKTGELVLPPGMPALTPIEVSLGLTRDGRITVSAKELISGRQLTFEAEAAHGMSADGVAQAQAASRSLMKV